MNIHSMNAYTFGFFWVIMSAIGVITINVNLENLY